MRPTHHRNPERCFKTRARHLDSSIDSMDQREREKKKARASGSRIFDARIDVDGFGSSRRHERARQHPGGKRENSVSPLSGLTSSESSVDLARFELGASHGEFEMVFRSVTNRYPTTKYV